LVGSEKGGILSGVETPELQIKVRVQFAHTGCFLIVLLDFRNNMFMFSGKKPDAFHTYPIRRREQ